MCVIGAATIVALVCCCSSCVVAVLLLLFLFCSSSCGRWAESLDAIAMCVHLRNIAANTVVTVVFLAVLVLSVCFAVLVTGLNAMMP